MAAVVPPTSPSTAEWFGWWLGAVLEGRRRRSTVENYRLAFDRQLGPIVGEIALEDLTRADLQGAIDTLSDVYSGSTVRLSVTALSGALDAAVAEGRLERNPVPGLILPARARSMRFIDPSRVPDFVEAALDPGQYWGPALVTIVTSGLRLAEIAGLRWSAVDERGRWIGVVEQASFRSYGDAIGPTDPRRWRPPKSTAAKRVIHLPSITADVLMRQRGRNARQALRVGSRRWTERDLVFPNSVGGFMPPTQITRHLARLCRAIDVEPVSIHGLRHTYATTLLEQGVELAELAKLLGHARVSTTIDLYTHLSDSMRSRGAEAWENVLRKGS